jgi:uncharacterized protein (UPF0264 family)
MKLLISFKNSSEFDDNIIKGIDILDLKDPEKGSIGSWVSDDIKNVVKRFKKKIKISATIGDITSSKILLNKLTSFDDFGLDYIKFAYFSKEISGLEKLINDIGKIKFKTKLVFVIFVDEPKILGFVDKNLDFLKKKKLNFILLDTFKKNNRDLTSYCESKYLDSFIKKCSIKKIKVGLAGRLRFEHIEELKILKPYLVGFRSAVCLDNKRNIICKSKLKNLLSNFR